jgi:hypothetical protein
VDEKALVDIGDGPERPMAMEEGRRAHGNGAVIHQPRRPDAVERVGRSHHELRLAIGIGPANANGDVEVLMREIDGADDIERAHLDIGLDLVEAEEARIEPFQRKARSRADRQNAVPLEAAEPPRCGVELVEGGTDRRQDKIACVGQDDRARVAMKQRCAVMLLEDLDLARDGALRDAEFLGRLVEIEVPSGRLESLDGIERWKLSGHENSCSIT